MSIDTDTSTQRIDVVSILEGERYISLETFRKNGTGVRTPVWFAVHEDEEEKRSIIVFTNGTSYKVKRLRRNTKCQVAACNMRGSVNGNFFAGQCRILDESKAEDKTLSDTAYRILNKKYGWQMRMLTITARLGRRRKDWTVLEISFPE